MTVRWYDILGQLARSTTTVGFEVRIPQGYHVPHCVGYPHWRIPNSSARINSSETRRCSSLSLKKLTELIWDFQWLHLKDWVGVGFWDEHHLEISFLVLPRPPLTVRCFLWHKKEKMKLRKQKSSCFMLLEWIPSLQDCTNFFTFEVFRKSSESQRSFEELHF